MDVDREGLAVVCYTDLGIIKGRVTQHDASVSSDGVVLPPAGPPMLYLVEASLLDSQHRIVCRVREMAVNRNAILFLYEDELAIDLGRIRSMIAREDYEAAASEVERLLTTNQRDADLFYLAGLVYERAEAGERAHQCFRKALEQILDDKYRAIVQHHLG